MFTWQPIQKQSSSQIDIPVFQLESLNSKCSKNSSDLNKLFHLQNNIYGAIYNIDFPQKALLKQENTLIEVERVILS